MLVKESLKLQRLIGKNLPMGAHARRIHKKRLQLRGEEEATGVNSYESFYTSYDRIS